MTRRVQSFEVTTITAMVIGHIVILSPNLQRIGWYGRRSIILPMSVFMFARLFRQIYNSRDNKTEIEFNLGFIYDNRECSILQSQVAHCCFDEVVVTV